jgi:hypothetical protein
MKNKTVLIIIIIIISSFYPALLSLLTASSTAAQEKPDCVKMDRPLGATLGNLGDTILN